MGEQSLRPLPQAVEKLVQGAESGCHSEKERQIVLNCSRLLTRVLPYVFEDPDWRGFFWSTVPGTGRGGVSGCDLAGGGGAGTGALSNGVQAGDTGSHCVPSRGRKMMRTPGPWLSPCSWPSLTCSSARTSPCRAIAGAPW